MASNRLREAAAGSDEELAIDMSPMIDMVFLLLIFFLVNATMIIVKQDPEVNPPVASFSKKAEDGKGRIVVNIYENGDVFPEYAEDGQLNNDADVEDYVRKAKEQIDQLGYEPKIHLRGDKEAVFLHCRKVIRAAARAGVDQVMFSTYNFEAK